MVKTVVMIQGGNDAAIARGVEVVQTAVKFTQLLEQYRTAQEKASDHRLLPKFQTLAIWLKSPHVNPATKHDELANGMDGMDANQLEAAKILLAVYRFTAAEKAKAAKPPPAG